MGWWSGSRRGGVGPEDRLVAGVLLSGAVVVIAFWAVLSASPAHIEQTWTHVREDGFERVLADGDTAITAYRRSGDVLRPVHLSDFVGKVTFVMDVPPGADEWAEGDRSSVWSPDRTDLAHMVVHVRDEGSILPGTVPHLRRGDPPVHAMSDPERAQGR